jgi:hypothetical protein
MLLIRRGQEALEVMGAPCPRLFPANYDRCRLLAYCLGHVGAAEGFELSPVGGPTR